MNAESLSVSSPIRGKGSRGRRPFYGFNDECLFANRKSHALSPSRRYVRQYQRMYKAAYDSCPAMHCQIDLVIELSPLSSFRRACRSLECIAEVLGKSSARWFVGNKTNVRRFTDMCVPQQHSPREEHSKR
jgi:hypothetical protein